MHPFSKKEAFDFFLCVCGHTKGDRCGIEGKESERHYGTM